MPLLPHSMQNLDPLPPLGKKIEPPSPPEKPEWVPYPGNKALEENTRTGQLRTRDMRPAEETPPTKPTSGWVYFVLPSDGNRVYRFTEKQINEAKQRPALRFVGYFWSKGGQTWLQSASRYWDEMCKSGFELLPGCPDFIPADTQPPVKASIFRGKEFPIPPEIAPESSGSYYRYCAGGLYFVETAKNSNGGQRCWYFSQSALAWKIGARKKFPGLSDKFTPL